MHLEMQVASIDESFHTFEAHTKVEFVKSSETAEERMTEVEASHED